MATVKVLVVLAALAGTAAADPQVQLDLDIGKVGVAYEQPVGTHVAIAAEATGFSTYFLPFIGGGIVTFGGGGGVRATYIGVGRRPLYVALSSHYERVAGDDEAGNRASGNAWLAGATVGQAFRTNALDVRVGFGAQWVHYLLRADDKHLRADVPFLALELVLGYRR
jgi:hypothetical protein